MSRGRQIVRLKLKPLSLSAKNLLLDWQSNDLYSHPENYSSLSSEGLFGTRKPLEVEIGAGSGEFICDLAKLHPAVNFLGIEVSHRAAEACAALAADHGIANLRVLRADFKLLGPLMPEAGWSNVYLHFPDPLNKNADKKRRIFDQAFLDRMTIVLVPGGEISVASDDQPFFLYMLELAERNTRFQKTHPERYLTDMEIPVKSRFQLFWERKGVQPLRFILRKKA